jgi:hypothetical protein
MQNTSYFRNSGFFGRFATLNSRTMKYLFALIISVLFSFPAFSQTRKTGYKLGFFITPGFNKSAVVSGNNSFIGPASSITYKDVADSVKKMDKMKYSTGFGASVMFNLGKNVELQTGLSYYELGFIRSKENFNFLEEVYPGGPRINDKSADKIIHFHYRFRYLQLPLLVNFGIPFKDMNFQYNIYGTAGLGLNYFLGDDLKAKTEGFTVDGKSEMSFDSTGFVMNKINMNASAGFRFEYLMKNKIIVSIQPLFNYHFIPSSSSQLKMQPYSFTISAGINYRFQKSEEEKK